jgi:hypothetical protein
MATKLDIKRVLSAVDSKDYEFYNNLSDEERKAFSPYVLLRYISNVDGDRDIQEWFLEKTHEYVNKHMWDLTKNHGGLLWGAYAAVGAGIPCKHQYIAASPREKTDKFEKFLAELNPAMKMADIKLMASLMDKNQRRELFDAMGFDNKQRKEYE